MIETTTTEARMFTDDDFAQDIVFDADDVDLSDLVDLSLGIHGTMCPRIVDAEGKVVPYASAIPSW